MTDDGTDAKPGGTGPTRQQIGPARQLNTDAFGRQFDGYVIEQVWQKARPVPGFHTFRYDAYGAEMARFQFGQSTQYGWHIDHIKPVYAGGTDDIDNLQPLHWENNQRKGDDGPGWREHKQG